MPLNNIYAFTIEEFDVLSLFVHTIKFPSIAATFDYQVFGRKLDTVEFESLVHEETLFVDDIFQLPMLYNPRLALVYNIKAIVTDKGSLVFCDFSDCSVSMLMVSDFCKYILEGCFLSNSMDVAIGIDDRIETIHEGYKFDNSEVSVLCVDISAVARKDLLDFFKYTRYFNKGYTVIRNGVAFK